MGKIKTKFLLVSVTAVFSLSLFSSGCKQIQAPAEERAPAKAVVPPTTTPPAVTPPGTTPPTTPPATDPGTTPPVVTPPNGSFQGIKLTITNRGINRQVQTSKCSASLTEQTDPKIGVINNCKVEIPEADILYYDTIINIQINEPRCVYYEYVPYGFYNFQPGVFYTKAKCKDPERSYCDPRLPTCDPTKQNNYLAPPKCAAKIDCTQEVEKWSPECWGGPIRQIKGFPNHATEVTYDFEGKLNSEYKLKRPMDMDNFLQNHALEIANEGISSVAPQAIIHDRYKFYCYNRHWEVVVGIDLDIKDIDFDPNLTDPILNDHLDWFMFPAARWLADKWGRPQYPGNILDPMLEFFN